MLKPRPLDREHVRLGVALDSKNDYPLDTATPPDLHSELLGQFEENDLLAGLRDAGFEVVRIGNAQKLIARISHWRSRCDLVFNHTVGKHGLEGKLLAPAILEAASIPYTGSSPYVQTLTRHKYHAKLVALAAGLNSPAAIVVTAPTISGLSRLDYPVFIKPLSESSSIGITAKSLARNPREARTQALDLLNSYGQPVLVESFVRGCEIEVPVVINPEPKALGAVAIRLDNAFVEDETFLTSELVYSDSYVFADPPRYVPRKQVMQAAEKAARSFGVRDWARFDFRVTRDGTPFFIEASTQPHIQRHSSFALLAAERGMQYHEMLRELTNIAITRISKETGNLRL